MFFGRPIDGVFHLYTRPLELSGLKANFLAFEIVDNRLCRDTKSVIIAIQKLCCDTSTCAAYRSYNGIWRSLLAS